MARPSKIAVEMMVKSYEASVAAAEAIGMFHALGGGGGSYLPPEIMPGLEELKRRGYVVIGDFFNAGFLVSRTTTLGAQWPTVKRALELFVEVCDAQCSGENYELYDNWVKRLREFRKFFKGTVLRSDWEIDLTRQSDLERNYAETDILDQIEDMLRHIKRDMREEARRG